MSVIDLIFFLEGHIKTVKVSSKKNKVIVKVYFLWI